MGFPDEDEDDISLPDPGTSPLLMAMQEHIRLHYEPTIDYVNAIRMTTGDIFEAMQQLFPSDIYDASYVATWLKEQGFMFKDEGGFKFVWMLKEVE